MTMRAIRTITPAVAFLLLLGGCPSAPTVRVGASSVSFEDVIALSDRMNTSLRSLYGQGDLRIESPSFSHSATFEVSLQKPDTLFLRLNGPFGITLGNALVTRQRFQFYNSLQNTLYTGDTSPENLEKALRLSLTFDDILALFTGGSVLSTDRTDPTRAESDGQDAVFFFTDGTSQRRYVVDPRTKQIRKLQFLDRNGSPIGEQAFSSFESAGEITVPRLIMLTQHLTRRRLTLSYDSFEWNTPPRHLPMSFPSSAERVELK